MRRFVPSLWLVPLLLCACSASHPPDACDDPESIDFDHEVCIDAVDTESRDSGRRPMRDAGRDARVREPGDRGDPDPDDDDNQVEESSPEDRPCRRGSTRKCLCPSGAYRDQMCSAERRWETCECSGPPPLVFGDAGVLDGGRLDAAVRPVPDTPDATTP